MQRAPPRRSGEYGGRELTIRCNGLDTQWGADDLAAIARIDRGRRRHAEGQLGGLPRRRLANARRRRCARLDDGLGDDRDTDGDLRRSSDRRASRVSVLVMGTNDLARELRAPLAAGRHPLLPHLATALLAAREAGKVILDGVYNDVKDLDGFRAECVQGVEIGFDGKTLIHPGQVDIANEAWAPTDDEVDHAAPGHRGVRRRRRRRSRRRHRRRPDDREPPRRQRPAHARHRRGHRRPRLTVTRSALCGYKVQSVRHSAVSNTMSA